MKLGRIDNQKKKIISNENKRLFLYFALLKTVKTYMASTKYY